VEEVLSHLRVSSTPRLLVWNKIDLLPADGLSRLPQGSEAAVPVSARLGTGLPKLLDSLEALLGEEMVDVDLFIPWSRYEVAARVLSQGTVRERQEGPEGVSLKASVPERVASQLAPFVHGTGRTS
jgi:GTP-binding protein HflX